jgi:hypothetical protein
MSHARSTGWWLSLGALWLAQNSGAFACPSVVVEQVGTEGAAYAAGLRPGDSIRNWRFGRLEGCVGSGLDLDRVEALGSSTGGGELEVDRPGEPSRWVTIGAGWWMLTVRTPLVLRELGSGSWYDVAQQARRSGQVAAAIDSYRNALRECGPQDRPYALAGLALALLDSGEFPEGIRAAADMISSAESDQVASRGFLLQASLQARSGDIAGAYASARMALELGRPQSMLSPSVAGAEAMMVLGVIHRSGGHLDEARAFLERSLVDTARVWPQSPLHRSIARELARLDVETGHPTLAMVVLCEVGLALPGFEVCAFLP